MLQGHKKCNGRVGLETYMAFWKGTYETVVDCNISPRKYVTSPYTMPRFLLLGGL